jgi:hypothetical protein
MTNFSIDYGNYAATKTPDPAKTSPNMAQLTVFT